MRTTPIRPTALRRTATLTTAAALLATLPAVSRAGTGTPVKVADTTTAVPGQSGVVFNGFGTPAISGANVAFRGINAGATNNQGLYTGAAGATPGLVADKTTAVPGQPGVVFSSFGTTPAISGANVAFFGTNAGATNSQGLYTGAAGATPGLVADKTTAVPGQPGVVFSNFGTAPAISGANVAFLGTNAGATNNQGLYTGAAGATPGLVADKTTAVPGQPGVVFNGFGSPAISGANVAFRGTNAGATSNQGLYTGAAGATPGLVADKTTAVPGQPGVVFNGFGTPAISGANVAFFGTNTGATNNQGLYLEADGSLSLVADKTTAVPGQPGVVFSSFGTTPAISGANVAFFGSYNNGSSRNGLFLEQGNTLVDVIDTGSPLFGSTVTGLNLGAFGLDGSTLSFQYSLASGVSGEAFVNVVPEPGTWALLLAGAGALLGGGRLARRRRLPAGAPRA